MKHLSEYLNTHKPHSYVRILGERPSGGPVAAEHRAGLQTLVNAFGPPEFKRRKRSTLVFWNFTQSASAGVFTLAARFRHNHNRWSPIRLTAQRGSLDFHVWVNDRIGGVSNGDEAPLFTGSGAFAISRVG